jgi:hypothetical protein
MKKVLLILATLSIMLSACGAATPTEETPPPLTGDDIQLTAVSMAWTMAAETIAAMPTATFTPLPPTATFTPEFTATPIATMTPLVTNTPLPTATAEGGGDPCNKILSGWSGRETLIVVKNELKQTVGVSLYLYQSDRGYCGYVSKTIAGKGVSSFTLPIGYYSAYVWATEGSSYNKYLDLTGVLNPDKHELLIRDNGLKFIGP